MYEIVTIISIFYAFLYHRRLKNLTIITVVNIPGLPIAFLQFGCKEPLSHIFFYNSPLPLHFTIGHPWFDFLPILPMGAFLILSLSLFSFLVILFFAGDSQLFRRLNICSLLWFVRFVMIRVLIFCYAFSNLELNFSRIPALGAPLWSLTFRRHLDSRRRCTPLPSRFMGRY